ncbi:MAG: 50S ribosomal protein L22 [Candidatus Latescibacteria bacterium]|jgi:large subunit ribosomal protein L22|nr:50S ribosomal protein L22 [Candidatus Latescibacterota bacterium]MBT4140513.1 50S ribosomal protein L22 [Candidatus Latescibacterota bacterium]MBT5830427.1 50S ribosomal protein L22 [Candidatus Latescibacterota bacterium]
MEAKAVLRYTKVSPRKARQVVDLVRGKGIEEAMNILQFTPKKAARMVERTLRSAVANAVNQDEATVREEELYVKEAFVDGGIGMKRMRPQPRGAAGMIRKRYSHITLIVADDE